MKALVLGGTGFIGRRLVDQLLSAGNEVTMVTSGKSANPFGKKVSTITADRFKRESLMKAFSGNAYFDVTFDTIGFRSMDVKNSLDALEGRTGKYVYISSAAVYTGNKEEVSEDDFDPSRTEDIEPGHEKSYGEGKQQSEVYIAKNSGIPYAMVRYPIVIGYDDSTMRFQDHISRILNGEEFHFMEPEGRRNYVWVEDAGQFLAWLGEPGNVGIYNAASPDAFKASDFVRKMADSIGMEAKIVHGSEYSDSGYAFSSSRVLSVRKAEAKGFSFHGSNEWIGPEAKKAREHGNLSPNSFGYFGDLF